MKSSIFLYILLMSSNVLAVQQLTNDYIGSERCIQCHEGEYQQWQKSHHAKAMLLPEEKNILGDFNDKVVTFNDVVTRFSSKNGHYFISTSNASNQLETYPIAYTFGYYPLQQYLIDIGDGKLQAFDIAWDSRDKKEGGQRWFKLLPNENTGHDSQFHWTRQLQNWNSRCAQCHSTGLQEGYDPLKHQYNTTYAEVNVACESCHGTGKLHVKLMKERKDKLISEEAIKSLDSGFKTNLKQSRSFYFTEKDLIAQALGEKSDAQINACGGCHSLRQIIGELDPSYDYHDQYLQRLLDDPLYYADGQIQEEVFVLGSFMQSKMYQAGVTCTNCHNAHTGEVKAKDNTLCAQCHKADHYDSPEHHHHQENSEAALCISCHMPATTYMEVDDRRDHAFQVPNPAQSFLSGSPDVCNTCHKARTSEWAATAINQWYEHSKRTGDGYASINAKSRNGDILALVNSVKYINTENNPPIRQATVLSQTGNIPSRLTMETLIKHLSSDNALLRRGAASASRAIPLQLRWKLLKNHLSDPSASVRYEVANQLSAYNSFAEGEDKKALEKLLQEYKQQLLRVQDMPAGQMQLSTLALNQGDVDGAKIALDNALEIEPNFVPALLNLADLLRRMGDDQQTRKYLERAVNIDPDMGAAQHALGLYWVRQKQLNRALPFLEAATKTDDRSQRYFYVYAIAQETSGDIDNAIETLKQANQLWPNQYDILLVLIQYLEKSGKTEQSWKYLSLLSAIAPKDPQVVRRVNRIKQSK